MPKQKTHKATSKVLNKHKSGLITYKKSGRNHQPNAKANGKTARQTRNKGQLAKGIADRLKNVI